MPNYQTSVVSTPAAASGAAFFTFHTAARRARVYKLIVTNTTTTLSSVGLVRSSNTPVATTSTTPQPNDTADAAATCALDTAWSTAPTVGANFWESFTVGPAIGAGIQDVWQADKEFTLATTSWFVGWNQGGSAGGVLGVTFAYDE